jgi:Na+-translocating ferredoxin:NAD+ oxidoreductase RnfC subunit
MNINEIKTLIFENGIVGAGGAGFPTHVKLSDKIDTIILNCCECEPLLRVDRQLLSIYTEEILEAVALIVDTVNADKGIIALKASYRDAVTALNNIIERFPKLSLKIVEEVYPAGDEVVLVYEITGKIVPEGGIPIDVGAAVINTETALNIYKAIFLNTPVTDKYVTVTGAVNNPITLKVPVGTKISKLIKRAGESSVEKFEIIMGGPMTGKIVGMDAVVSKTTKSIIVLPEDHPVILKRHIKTSISLKRAMSVCSQCQMCTDLCPRNLLGHSIRPHKVMNAIANGVTSDINAFTSAMLCSECGLCEMYSCYQGLSPKSLIGELKSKLRSKGVKNPHKVRPEKAHPMREARKVPMERLIARLSLTAYNAEAPINEEKLQVYSVNIPLKQHVGVAAAPVVKVGDKVSKGQLIGNIEEGKLGAKLHASIDGIISAIDSISITIEARGDICG